MHVGSISNDLTDASRVYAALRQASGRWVNGYELDEALVPDVRHQLPEDETIEMKQNGHRCFYRLVRARKAVAVEQLALV